MRRSGSHGYCGKTIAYRSVRILFDRTCNRVVATAILSPKPQGKLRALNKDDEADTLLDKSEKRKAVTRAKVEHPFGLDKRSANLRQLPTVHRVRCK